MVLEMASYIFNIPFRDNEKLRHVIDEVKRDVKLQTFWRCSNVMAIDRMGFTDHGPTHVKIVANLALKLLRILAENDVVPSVVKDYGMKNEDAEVVVVLGSIFHDLGMIVTRNDHELYGALLASELVERLLRGIYSEEDHAIMLSEVLHAIVSHEEPRKPLTLEAGIVRVADALDMEKGRARIPFQAGKVDIHSVSALSIEKVSIQKGGEKPVTVNITMSNSAGIFQIDELLKPRIKNSGLADYLHVVAEITGEKERKILRKFEI
ncbi:MAG TPA: HD domain-containing protein [Candidatus Bathyarchaeia archaeon]|nr:HD domain-containing protein [Candidatus Bathyarchaeia archaeon]